MRPVLAHLVDGEVRRTRDVKDSMADAFELTADERGCCRADGNAPWTTASGGPDLPTAGGPGRPAGARGRVVINAAGRDALASNPDRIDMKTLEAYPAYLDFRERTCEKVSTDPVPDVEMPPRPTVAPRPPTSWLWRWRRTAPPWRERSSRPRWLCRRLASKTWSSLFCPGWGTDGRDLSNVRARPVTRVSTGSSARTHSASTGSTCRPSATPKTGPSTGRRSTSSPVPSRQAR